MTRSKEFKPTASDLAITAAGVAVDISYIKADISNINSKLDDHYVTKDQFAPIQRLVYGLVGLILIAVVGAILALVLRK
jgi:hypothetical protein